MCVCVCVSVNKWWIEHRKNNFLSYNDKCCFLFAQSRARKKKTGVATNDGSRTDTLGESTRLYLSIPNSEPSKPLVYWTNAKMTRCGVSPTFCQSSPHHYSNVIEGGTTAHTRAKEMVVWLEYICVWQCFLQRLYVCYCVYLGKHKFYCM